MDPMITTDVILTIDTEFSIAGTFSDPARFKPVGPQAVLGAANGEEHGLGFILATLARHRARATFFVEAMNTSYFGLEPMGAIARRIRDAGHDVQLHVHPCWLAFDHGPYVRKPGAPAPNDDCGAFTAKALSAILKRAIDVFERWGLERPVALRTGGFNVSRQVYVAQRDVGIPIGSNVCTAITPSRDEGLHFRSGRHLIDGTVEIPALSFVDRRTGGKEHLRPLQITSASTAELRLVLSRAHGVGLDTVVAVTHAFEFFKRRNGYDDIKRDRINQRRLDAFCTHVSNHPDELRWTTFGERAAAWTEAPPSPDRAVNGSPILAALRMAQNGINDKMWWI
jgi:hypothetical protein